MNMNLFKKVSRNILFKLVDVCIPYGQTSFSQEGEDLILQRYFEGKTKGFFVDIGAHHPIRFSNTYHFYRRGWRGINIDACPDSMKLFKKIRPKDINLEMGVGLTDAMLDYYMFDEPALNSFDRALSEERNRDTAYRIVDIRSIRVSPLSKILDQHLNNNQTSIDFFNVDVEGLDLDVLKSNNWERYSPTLIITESLKNSIADILQSGVNTYLVSVGYQLVSKTINSLIYRKDTDS